MQNDVARTGKKRKELQWFYFFEASASFMTLQYVFALRQGRREIIRTIFNQLWNTITSYIKLYKCTRSRWCLSLLTCTDYVYFVDTFFVYYISLLCLNEINIKQTTSPTILIFDSMFIYFLKICFTIWQHNLTPLTGYKRQ